MRKRPPFTRNMRRRAKSLIQMAMVLSDDPSRRYWDYELAELAKKVPDHRQMRIFGYKQRKLVKAALRLAGRYGLRYGIYSNKAQGPPGADESKLKIKMRHDRVDVYLVDERGKK